MPRPKKAVSPLALYCTALRLSRDLTQADLAGIAGIHESTVKNAEGDRPLAFETLALIYRTSLKGPLALSNPEWHQLVGYWLLKAVPGCIVPAELAAGVSAAAASTADGIQTREKTVLDVLSRLEPDDAATFTTLAELATGARGSRILSAIRALLELLK